MMDPEDIHSALIELDARSDDHDNRIEALLLRVSSLEAVVNSTMNIGVCRCALPEVKEAQRNRNSQFRFVIDTVRGKPYDPSLHMTMVAVDDRSRFKRFIDRLWQVTWL